MKGIIKLVAIACLLPFASYSQDDIVLTGKELFGDLKARHIGPALMSGRFTDLEGHPTNDRIIYAGAAGGGVWKSIDGGVNFNPIFEDYPQSIGDIEIDPSAPDKVIWVGTGETWTRNSVSVGNGLYQSVDGGVNWQLKGFKGSERISSVEVNPDNPQEVFVGVLGPLWSDNEMRGVYKSVDGGENWEKVLYIGPGTGCGDLVMDPSNPSVLYASMWEFRRTAWSFNSGGTKSGLFKSTDGGKTWDKIHNGFPSGKLGRIAMAVAPSDPNVLYAAIESEKNENKGLYKSTNAGESWEHLNKDFGLVVRPFYFSRIVVDPKNPDVLIKGGLFGSISRDGGKTFKNLGQMHPDIHDFWFDINNSDRLYAATDGGVYRSWDGGNSLEIVENLPVSQFYHISVDNEEPYNVYGGLQDNGSWYGPSSSPGGVEARDWNSVGFGDGFRVLRHPSKKIVYSEMQGAENVWRFDIELNKSKTIQPLPEEGDPKLRFNWNAPISLSENQPDRIYVGSQFLHKSDDMGDTWVKVSPDLTTNDPNKQNQIDSGGLSKDNSGAENHCTIFTIAESALDENVIWVGTDDGNVQITQDGGKTWTNTVANISGLPANTWCYHIEASKHNKGTAYAVFDGHTTGDPNTYVYKTTDFGATWKSIVTDEIEGFARSIQEDTEKEDLLFLGTEFGLYITINGGNNWNKFTNNLPAVAVHHLELQEQTNDIVMGTHGRGVIIIDDISPLRQINQEVLAKKVHFFDTEPTVMLEQSGFGGTFGGTAFVGPNPSTDAKIIYYLKKRHIFGKMTIEIQDQQGNTLIELPAGKSRGINVATWNYEIRQPKVAKGKSFSFGGFTSPRVLPGTYKVLMKKGKETYESQLELVPDPTSLMTEEGRIAKHKTTMELYRMSEDLAYLVYELDEIVAKAEQLKKDNPSAKKVASPVIEELTALKETLVITTGDNYVGAADPQLREDLADLYSKIASGFVEPSDSEMRNYKLIKDRFDKAKADYSRIKDKRVAKMNGFIEKNELEPIKLKTKDEFISQ